MDTVTLSIGNENIMWTGMSGRLLMATTAIV